ncbi:SusE domain-containing protein [Cytophagaceae bacterium DM2B3-1]|uniref:SusE domain-containing protein n=1 Tax=Xanthocytophaga flava TaxID=3048013 RepID=A0ABT7CUN3_9BACT|nr:SusF/SusE family outer membrane protein [Xanthocytophaga flavus]MDJ1497438.1 SusE domain-containing protein [Xanthocytophaga flavus]
MRKYINILLVFCTILIGGTACEKDAELTVLKPVSFTGTPQISAADIVLNKQNKNESVLSISWPEVSFPVKAPVTYTVQIDVPADTLGTTAWANAKTVTAGEDVLSKSFLGSDLNNLAKGLGLVDDQKGTLVMRVQSTLDRSVYSSALAVAVTPYSEVTQFPSALWVAGDFQGWNVTAAPTLISENNDGIYEGYIYIPQGGTNEFKLYAQAAWEPMSYGDAGGSKIMEANYAGGNFKTPSDGYYLLAVNLNTMSYLLLKTSWGIIGAATPGGWDADTPMTYDAATQTWKVTAAMKANGSFKFRANNAWQLDFGIDANGKPAYANHPWRTYVDQPQFTVPDDGNYTITLDLHKAGNYKYTLQKN